MIDLRNHMPDNKNKERKRKVCPVMPPVVTTRVVNNGEGTITQSDVLPIICFGEDCEFFCEIHDMCMHMCDHMEMVHGFGLVDDDEEVL